MTASSVSVLDGVSGIDAARLIDMWREVVDWRTYDDVTARLHEGRFDAYANTHDVPAVARDECKRIAREVLS